ncbi:MAG TPA: hypothetical protein VNK43_04930 [Gemmatimonadales bacterium]|nr:hypothetical protein [Gemmatimonadales bacterium]
MSLRFLSLLTLVLAHVAGSPVPASAQGAGRAAARPGAAESRRSAPLANLRYEVTFDSATAAEGGLEVALTFDVAGPGAVLLSLPVWTPGAYDVSNFARHVRRFSARAGDRELDWDKIDPDTWRIQPGGARTVTVRFRYLADSLDNAMAWARPDFVFFNGTNVFLYPEGRGFDFPATVTVKTRPEWQVATGMRPGGAPRTYREANYHDLVDMPFFIGRIDLDSMQIEGKWQRLATYPAGALAGPARAKLWDDLRRMTPPQVAVFGEQPWDTYTTLIVIQPGNGSALEHQNSHLGLYDPQFIGTPILASITAHEMFHAWNVKRLRPAELVPYEYERWQPTPLLWVSEGITDYYADLALVRGGIVDSAAFMASTSEKISQVSLAEPVALEDASLSTWIQPTDGTAYLYYPKGSLAGLMLDIMIRDASDNRGSLDDVLRELYRTTYKRGRGFTTDEFYAAASRAAGGRSFAEFHERYIDGREPYPWSTVLPLAGMRLEADSTRIPRLGVNTGRDSAGVLVAGLVPGGALAAAGARVGDYLVQVGEIPVEDQTFGARFRGRYGREPEGTPLTVTVRRGADTLQLAARLQFETVVAYRVTADPAANEKAVRIRSGLFRGTTGRQGTPGR